MNTRKKFPILKTDEKAWGGRRYSRSGVKSALEKMKWDASLPIVGEDREKNRVEFGFLKKTDIEFDELSGILYVYIPTEIIPRIFGRALVPYVQIDYVRRDKETAYIDDFTLCGVQVTSDMSSFPSINSTVQ